MEIGFFGGSDTGVDRLKHVVTQQMVLQNRINHLRAMGDAPAEKKAKFDLECTLKGFRRICREHPSTF